MTKLRRAQDIVSQKTRKAASYEETLTVLLEFFLQRQDPVERAKRALSAEIAEQPTAWQRLRAQQNRATAAVSVSGKDSRNQGCHRNNAPASVPGTHNFAPAQSPNKAGRFIPSHIKHVINMRDQGQCTQVDKTGERCESQRWLEIHHKIPIARNGTNDIWNLQTLCHAHHKQQHLF